MILLGCLFVGGNSYAKIIGYETFVLDNGLEVVVLNLHVFDSFKEIYEKFDKERLGYKENEVAHYKDMEQYI